MKIRALLFLICIAVASFLAWFAYDFASNVPWVLPLTSVLLLYFLWFSFRFLFREGVAYYRRHAWFNSFVALVPLAFFGIGLLGILILNGFIAAYPTPRAFLSDPHSESRLRFAYAAAKAGVLVALSLTTAVLTIRSRAPAIWFYLGCVVLAFIGAFRHTNVHISPTGSQVGFALSLSAVDWSSAFLSLPAVIWVYATRQHQ